MNRVGTLTTYIHVRTRFSVALRSNASTLISLYKTPWTVDHLARGSMKNAANCASTCELQDTWTSTFRTHIAVLGYCSWTTPGWGSCYITRLPVVFLLCKDWRSRRRWVSGNQWCFVTVYFLCSLQQLHIVFVCNSHYTARLLKSLFTHYTEL